MIRTALAIAAFGLVACDTGPGAEQAPPPPPVTFDTTRVVIASGADTIPLTVELAETPDQRAYGLMERESLGAEHGMLFRYPAAQDSTQGFWMFRTLIPLDIAFLDDDGRILAIRSMEPCASPNPQVCRRYGPGVPFHAALEVNRGFFEREGVETGDRVAIPEVGG